MIEGVRSPSLDYEFVTNSFWIATKFDTQLAPRASRIKRIGVFNRTSGCPHTIALLTKLAFFLVPYYGLRLCLCPWNTIRDLEQYISSHLACTFGCWRLRSTVSTNMTMNIIKSYMGTADNKWICEWALL